MNGDRATRTSMMYDVLVTAGDQSFRPTSALAGPVMQDHPYFRSYSAAFACATNVSEMLDAPLEMFKRVGAQLFQVEKL